MNEFKYPTETDISSLFEIELLPEEQVALAASRLPIEVARQIMQLLEPEEQVALAASRLPIEVARQIMRAVQLPMTLLPIVVKAAKVRTSQGEK